MQDGQNLFDKVTSFAGEWQMDETVEHLVGGFRIPPMFVVGIDNGGEKRSSEYLPYPDPHNDKDGVSEEKDVHGKEYARFVVTEVMPLIEKRYRISRGAMNAGIGGSSYGGDAALYTALEYPGTFGHLLIESPALWIGDGQLIKEVEKAKVLPQKIYLGIGTDEDPSDPKLSEESVKRVQELESELRKKGSRPEAAKACCRRGRKAQRGILGEAIAGRDAVSVWVVRATRAPGCKCHPARSIRAVCECSTKDPTLVVPIQSYVAAPRLLPTG